MPGTTASTLDDLVAEFELLKREFVSDGRIDDDERAILVSVAKKIKAARRLSGAKAGGSSSVATAPFDDARFKRQFEQSIKDWAQDAQIALNRVKTYFIEEKKPEGLTVDNLLKVVKVAMLVVGPEAKEALDAISTVAEVVVAAYRASLPKTPSLNEIQSSWSEALGRYGRASHGREYAAFVRDWKKKHAGAGPGGDRVPVDEFLAACQDFGKGLPKQNAIEKAFLTEVLKHVEDGWDWDSESGVAEIGLTCMNAMAVARGVGEGYFGNIGGQLDDVSEQLMGAIRTVWKNERAYHLPVKMLFTIKDVSSTTVAEIERTSNEPGNTSFRLKSGSKRIFESFVKQKTYARMTVKHLSAD